jgi:hypothetical protein
MSIKYTEEFKEQFISKFSSFLLNEIELDELDEMSDSDVKNLISKFFSESCEKIEEKKTKGKKTLTDEIVTKKGDGKCTFPLRSGKNKGHPCGSKESESGSSRCKKHVNCEEELSEKKAYKKKITKDNSQPTISSFTKKSKKEEDKKTNDDSVSEEESADEKEVKKTKKDSKKKVPHTSPPKPGKLGKKGLDLDGMDKKEVMKIIQTRKQQLVLTKKGEHYVHHGTNLVFDKDSESVKGRLMPNGELIPLSENDIQLCVANNWTYGSMNGKVNVRSLPDLESTDDDDDDDLYEDVSDEENISNEE